MTPGWTIGYLLGGLGFNYVNLIWAIGGMFLAFIVDLMESPSIRPLSGYPKDPCGDLELDDQGYYECVELMKDEGFWYYDEMTEGNEEGQGF